MRKYLRTIAAVVKIATAQLYVATFGGKYLNENAWIFGEKTTEARDNGYHFFKYIRSAHSDINAHYVIRRNSPDSDKVKVIGDVIDYDSFKHCIYYCAAQVRACSQIHGVCPYEDVKGIRHIHLFRRKDQLHINLKHGITKDFRPSAFDYRKAGYDLYISGAKPEYDAIKEAFHYPDRNIALTGFCRFDALHDLASPDKTILIMPTFRDWLRTSSSVKDTASETEMVQFLQSGYFAAYRSLLTDARLIDGAREAGYRIFFFLHYTFQPYVAAFESMQNDVVTICDRKNYDVQRLLISSAVLITDFSSVLFDFGYMMKPMLFYQFDLEEYRTKHYQQGYFSYEHDAFGPVLSTSNDVVEYTLKLLSNGSKMEAEYKARAERFFVPYDNKNCERVYDAIRKLEGAHSENG